MAEKSDALSLLITAVMVALIRLIDAWLALEAGLPLSRLEARSLADLDAEAAAYVERILADRRSALKTPAGGGQQ